MIDVIERHQIDLTACAISPINRMEVLGFGQLTQQDSQNFKRLLNNITTLPIDRTLENTVIDLRKRHTIKLPDVIILASALVHQLNLLSLDQSLIHKYHKELNPFD